jgi:trimethylamine--corrinoid protein Co-methyltransferase
MRVNYQVNSTPQFKILTIDQIEEIVSASMEILERIGIRNDHEEAVALLKEGGALPVSGNVLKIPSFMVKKALSTAPQRVVLAGRNRKRNMVLEKDRIYYGTGSDLPFTVDPYTNERRTAVFNDVVNAARVLDALPNLDFFMSFGIVSDFPPEHYDRHQFLAMLMGTAKPYIITSVDGKGLKDHLYRTHFTAGSSENSNGKGSGCSRIRNTRCVHSRPQRRRYSTCYDGRSTGIRAGRYTGGARLVSVEKPRSRFRHGWGLYQS